MEHLQINAKRLKRILLDFIRKQTRSAGLKRVVVGISGGLDSAVVAFLCSEALGRKNVLGVLLPYKESNPQSVKDAKMIVRQLGIKSKMVEITPMVDAYYEINPDKSKLRKGNKIARERMAVLYDLSAREKALVVGTGNKTELLLGYFTLFGDGAYAFNPIGDLYKTQVRLLAKELGVPEKIMKKIPSADLWKGQTDEGELGITYDEVDRLLYYLVEKKHGPKKLKRLGFKTTLIAKVKKIIEKTEFKRQPPKIAKIPLEKIRLK